MKNIEKYINYIISVSVISSVLFICLCLIGIVMGNKEMSYLNLWLSFTVVNLLSLNYIISPSSKLSKFLPDCIKDTFKNK